jgi:hypothetical protein
MNIADTYGSVETWSLALQIQGYFRWMEVCSVLSLSIKLISCGSRSFKLAMSVEAVEQDTFIICCQIRAAGKGGAGGRVSPFSMAIGTVRCKSATRDLRDLGRCEAGLDAERVSKAAMGGMSSFIPLRFFV